MIKKVNAPNSKWPLTKPVPVVHRFCRIGSRSVFKILAFLSLKESPLINDGQLCVFWCDIFCVAGHPHANKIYVIAGIVIVHFLVKIQELILIIAELGCCGCDKYTWRQNLDRECGRTRLYLYFYSSVGNYTMTLPKRGETKARMSP
jgi:hypothetical protein